MVTIHRVETFLIPQASKNCKLLKASELTQWAMELTVAEKTALEREFTWLLQEEMPNLVVQLHKILSDCSNKFFGLNPAPKQRKQILFDINENLAAKPGKYIFSSRNSADNFKGVVTLFQNVVVSADLQIKLPSCSQLLRANIREDNPWKVQQIQTCSNLLTKMLSLLNHHTSNSVTYTRADQILKLLNQLTTLLNSARTTLDNPPSFNADLIAHDRQKAAFNPPLPLDFSVLFTVLRDRLVVNAAHVQTVRPDGRKVSAITPATMASQDTRLGGSGLPMKKIEILSKISESSPVPWLTTLVVSISFCLEQCQLMKDKITMFEQYNIYRIS